MAKIAEWHWTPKRVKAVILTAQGETAVSIAETLGVSPSSIAHWRRAPEFMERLKELEKETCEEARGILRRHTIKAVNCLAELMAQMESGGTLRLAAATQILDRVGISAITKIAPTTPDGQGPYEGMSDDELRAALLAAARAIAGNGALPLEPACEAEPTPPSG